MFFSVSIVVFCCGFLFEFSNVNHYNFLANYCMRLLVSFLIKETPISKFFIVNFFSVVGIHHLFFSLYETTLLFCRKGIDFD